MQLPAHQLQRELSREPTPWKGRVRTDAADLMQVAGAHALAGHGDELAAVEVAKVFAQLGRAWTERPGIRELRQLHCLARNALGSSSTASGAASSAGGGASQTILNICASLSMRQPAGAGPGQMSR